MFLVSGSWCLDFAANCAALWIQICRMERWCRCSDGRDLQDLGGLGFGTESLFILLSELRFGVEEQTRWHG